MEAADSSGVFYPLSGGGRQIFNFSGCFSEKELDASAVVLNIYALLSDIYDNRVPAV